VQADTLKLDAGAPALIDNLDRVAAQKR